MGSLIVSIFTTLDGVIERPNRWAFQFVSPDSMEQGLRQIREAEALLLGRVTYEGFAAAWPNMSDEAGFADRMNTLPKHVISTTLGKPQWNNTTVIRDGVAERVAELKAETAGDVLVYGSPTLTCWLLRYGLLDELRLVTYPVVIGSGKRLFDDVLDATVLDLVETTAFASGVVLLTYAPTGRALASAA